MTRKAGNEERNEVENKINPVTVNIRKRIALE